MIGKETLDEKLRTKRFISLVRVMDLKGDMLNYVDDVYHLNIYEVVEPGVLKLTHGVGNKAKRNLNMYFDVSGLPKTFHFLYERLITEMEVTKIIDEPPKRVTYREGKIVTLLPIDESYGDLDKNTLTELGYDYVQLLSVPEGLKISSVLIASEAKDALYLKVNTDRLNEDTLQRLKNQMVELVDQGNEVFVPLVANNEHTKDFK